MSARAARIGPFPFDALPAVSREDLAARRSLLAVVRRLVRPEAVANALGELAGEPVTMALRRTQRLDATTLPDSAISVMLAPAAATPASPLRDAVVVEVDAALAAAVVTRALKQKPARILDPARRPSPAVAGAFAAVLHAALRRAHAGEPLRVLAAGPAPALARDLANASANGGARRITTAVLAVTVGPELFAARVLVPWGEAHAELAAPAARLGAADLAALGEAPLALPVVAATCLAGRFELASLARGDVFVVPDFALAASATGALVGPVALVPPRGERGLGAALAAEGRLVISAKSAVTHSWSREPEDETMAGAAEQTALTLEVLEDAPLVVRVELGVVEMKALAWASLAEGDVVTLGRKLGDPAILRVGGVEVARGELVQVDGEYGVRILRKTSHDEETS